MMYQDGARGNGAWCGVANAVNAANRLSLGMISRVPKNEISSGKM